MKTSQITGLVCCCFLALHVVDALPASSYGVPSSRTRISNSSSSSFPAYEDTRYAFLSPGQDASSSREYAVGYQSPRGQEGGEGVAPGASQAQSQQEFETYAASYEDSGTYQRPQPSQAGTQRDKVLKDAPVAAAATYEDATSQYRGQESSASALGAPAVSGYGQRRQEGDRPQGYPRGYGQLAEGSAASYPGQGRPQTYEAEEEAGSVGLPSAAARGRNGAAGARQQQLAPSYEGAWVSGGSDYSGQQLSSSSSHRPESQPGYAYASDRRPQESAQDSSYQRRPSGGAQTYYPKEGTSSSSSSSTQKGMPYSFHYSVKDEPTGNDYSREEKSDGEVVTGRYQVLLPDGRTQVVTYRADWKNGFTARVEYIGEATYESGDGSAAQGSRTSGDRYYQSGDRSQRPAADDGRTASASQQRQQGYQAFGASRQPQQGYQSASASAAQQGYQTSSPQRQPQDYQYSSAAQQQQQQGYQTSGSQQPQDYQYSSAAQQQQQGYQTSGSQQPQDYQYSSAAQQQQGYQTSSPQRQQQDYQYADAAQKQAYQTASSQQLQRQDYEPASTSSSQKQGYQTYEDGQSSETRGSQNRRFGY